MSVSPWPHYQSPGGGAVIPCSYIIQVHSDHQQGLGKVCDAVEEMAENSVTKVIMPIRKKTFDKDVIGKRTTINRFCYFLFSSFLFTAPDYP